MPSPLNKWTIFFSSNRDSLSRKKIFDEIWKHYYKRLMFFIRNFVGEDAEDLLQEIMLKIYQNMEKFNPVYSFNTWIYTIARNHCFHFLEKKRGTNVGLGEIARKEEYSTQDTPENEIMGKELHRRIDHLLKQLDPAYQQMAFLRFYEGMKMKQIARIMDVPVGTIKSRIHLIKKALKKELEEYGES